MVNSTDRRVQKTRIALENALIQLLKNRPLNEITVTEITAVANVHRGTFYLHYKDIFDLFHDVEKSYILEFKKNAETYLGKGAVSILTFFENIYEFFYTNRLAFKTVICTNHSTLIDQIIELRHPKSFEDWKTNYRVGNRSNYLYLYASISASFRSLIKHWCKNNFDKSPKELAAITKDILSFYGYKHL